jgi:NAD(P)H-flavin reductase
MTEIKCTRVRSWRASERVLCVEVMPPGPFEFLPGHVVTLQAGTTGPGYFAIGSAPLEGLPLRFYLRSGGEAADAVLATEDGGQIVVTGPIATGFPLDGLEGRDLLFVGVGTGVAPLRSALVEALGQRDRFGRLILVLGAATPEALCCAEEFDGWTASGVEVVCTVDEAGPGWDGPIGFVQACLGALDLDGLNTVAHVAGVRAMEEAVRGRLAELGFPADQVRANY